MNGLTSAQAAVLLKQYGWNILPEAPTRAALLLFVDQFKNLLVLFLLIGAVISFVFGNPLDGWLIVTIIILNAVFGMYQEQKASRAIAALKNLTVSHVRVIRDGKQIEIDSKFLVPGDVVIVENGTKVPADGTLTEAVMLHVNESALTGESAPVMKHTGEMVYMGTVITQGRARMHVTAVGGETKFGKIASSLSSMQEERTPLENKLRSLTRSLGLVGILLSFIVYWLSQTGGVSSVSSFLLAVSLAVAFAPEALPAVMTITLAIGTREMAKRNVIIRKLSAIEALGNVTLIATDKTGTLTTNQMKVTEVFVDNVVHDEHFPSVKNEAFMKLLHAGILCSTASLMPILKGHRPASTRGEFDILGDPTEGALLLLAEERGVSVETVRGEWVIHREKPFDSVTKLMEVEVAHGKQEVQYIKGALESVLKRVSVSQKERERIESVAHEWAKTGLRVMAFAYHQRSQKQMAFLGMVGIQDPPRPEVKEAVERAENAGIRVVMVTGDNAETAEAIGKKVGLLHQGDEIMTGDQLEQYSDAALKLKLPNVRIFARTNPFQKSRIVTLYQQLGEVVAVTGDGVNDAIALKQAHVGVAMGEVGTDVAREAADMVITDDNFATIVSAISEGRVIIRRLQNTIKYLLASNVCEAVTIVAALIAGIPTLLIPAQILFINLIGDGLPAVSLAFAPHDTRLKREKSGALQLITSFDKVYIFAVSVLSAGITLGGFLYASRYGIDIARTAAFSILAMIQAFIFVDLWFNHESFLTKQVKHISLSFVGVVLFPIFLQFLIIQIPALAGLFHVRTVPFSMFVEFVTIASLILVAITATKIFNFKF